MSSKNSSGKTVTDAESTTNNDESERGAVYGAASDERIEEFREFDRVQYPDEERETEFDLSIDGVPGNEIGQKRAEQGRLDRGTDEAVNGSWGGPGGESEYDDKSLYTQERIKGREAELETISKRAGANPEVHPRPEKKEQREQRTMETHQKRMEECREEVEAEAASGIVSRGFEDDPREHLESETVGEIYEQSQRVADRFDRTRHVIAKRLAEKVANGKSISGAVMSLVEDLHDDRTVVSPLSMVEADDSWATVEGVVAKLFEPASRNQQQVAILEDESGEAKLTIWRNSNKEVRLNEGDVVRVVDAKPGAYSNQTTLAATSDTRIWTHERGGGRSVGNFGYGANGGQTQDRRKGSSPSMSSEPVTRPEHDRVNHRERMFFRESEVPDGFEEREDVERFESEGSDAVAFMVTVRERFNTHGVSWADKKRKEAEEKAREQRRKDRKYNVPEWKIAQRSCITNSGYLWEQRQQFGFNERQIHLDLPVPSNDE